MDRVKEFLFWGLLVAVFWGGAYVLGVGPFGEDSEALEIIEKNGWVGAPDQCLNIVRSAVDAADTARASGSTFALIDASEQRLAMVEKTQRCVCEKLPEHSTCVEAFEKEE